LSDLENLGSKIREMPDEKIWALRTGCCNELIPYVRKHLARQRASQGASLEQIQAAERVFDGGILTLGFARRFATYKRPNLLLLDPQRLLRILTDPKHPVQLILAGKAHPEDRPGQELIREWSEFVARPEVRGRAVFLSDYDMLMANQLVQGVDVWINTPRRPWEASGTSGMKVLANGGLNLSELDGWWAEAYSPEVGWAIGDGREHDSDPGWDRAEAEQLYALLENEVVPAFYTRDDRGIPRAWVAKMRESTARLAPQFSANRAVREYTESYYVPAAAEYRRRAADGGKAAAELAAWEGKLALHWPGISFGPSRVQASGDEYTFEICIDLAGLAPEDVLVELYAEPAFRRPMLAGSLLPQGQQYSARAPANRPVGDYTGRVIPAHAGMRVPLELAEIAWHK
jgi:starch phosphorylase